MRIAVISDTHANTLADLPSKLVDVLPGVDLIVHLGDFTGHRILDDLRAIGTCRGVAGNMDPASIKIDLPDKDVIEVAGQRIGLVHGSGTPAGIAERVCRQFPRDIDAILFGHSHQAMNEVVDDTLLFNPGSPTRPLGGGRPSFGILLIDEQGIRGETIWL